MTWSSGPTQVLTNNSLTQYLFMFGTINPKTDISDMAYMCSFINQGQQQYRILKTGVRGMKEYRSFVHKVPVEWPFN